MLSVILTEVILMKTKTVFKLYQNLKKKTFIHLNSNFKKLKCHGIEVILTEIAPKLKKTLKMSNFKNKFEIISVKGTKVTLTDTVLFWKQI